MKFTADTPGERLDAFLSRAAELSRSAAQKLIEQGAVLKNGNAFELTTSPAKKAMAYYEFENPSTLEVWTGNVYAYANAEKTTGFLIIQPSNGETLTLTAPTSLTKVYLGFQEGKTIAPFNVNKGEA